MKTMLQLTWLLDDDIEDANALARHIEEEVERVNDLELKFLGIDPEDAKSIIYFLGAKVVEIKN